jgi:hypothetical protein
MVVGMHGQKKISVTFTMVENIQTPFVKIVCSDDPVGACIAKSQESL